jgi:hypothetical protein
MNDEATNLDRTDEDILTPTISDEAIEAAAGSLGFHGTCSIGGWAGGVLSKWSCGL